MHIGTMCRLDDLTSKIQTDGGSIRYRYITHMKNLAPKFDHNKLLPQLSEVNQTALQQGPIQRVEDLQRTYPELFDVIGRFEGEYYMVTDPNVLPSLHAMRKVPIEYQEKIEKKLDRMEEQGIITKVTELSGSTP